MLHDGLSYSHSDTLLVWLWQVVWLWLVLRGCEAVALHAGGPARYAAQRHTDPPTLPLPGVHPGHLQGYKGSGLLKVGVGRAPSLRPGTLPSDPLLLLLKDKVGVGRAPCPRPLHSIGPLPVSLFILVITTNRDRGGLRAVEAVGCGLSPWMVPASGTRTSTELVPRPFGPSPSPSPPKAPFLRPRLHGPLSPAHYPSHTPMPSARLLRPSVRPLPSVEQPPRPRPPHISPPRSTPPGRHHHGGRLRHWARGGGALCARG